MQVAFIFYEFIEYSLLPVLFGAATYCCRFVLHERTLPAFEVSEDAFGCEVGDASWGELRNICAMSDLVVEESIDFGEDSEQSWH